MWSSCLLHLHRRQAVCFVNTGQNKNTGRRVGPAQVFTKNIGEFKEKQVAKQISHILGSPVQSFSLRQQQRWDVEKCWALLIWMFLKGYSVSHLPSLQTKRKWDRETSRRACHKASQGGVFWRHLLISCTKALTFFPFLSCSSNASCLYTQTHTLARTNTYAHPNLPSPGSVFKWCCILASIRMGPRHGNNVHFECVLFKC